jgi:hypothetical protein
VDGQRRLGVVHLHDLWTLELISRRSNSLVRSKQEISAEETLWHEHQAVQPHRQEARKPH